MKDSEQKKAARQFAEQWKDRGYEKGESQSFWIDLLHSVMGIERPQDIITFEDKVNIDKSNGFIDGYIHTTKVMIEQKGSNKDLRAPIRQSDGTLLTPFQQAKRYITELPVSEHPRWVVTCNFRSFLVYDMDNPHGEPEEIMLENLEREYYRLRFLTETRAEHIQKELEVSMQAGEIIGNIYDELLKEYHNPESESTLKSLNILCVRLVFCLYAEDAGVFGHHDMFHDYLAHFKPGKGDMRRALIDLFHVLNTPTEQRDQYMADELLAFPYCNGGLFADETIEIPRFNDRIAHLLLQNASLDFDWSQISPTIFGAVFESTLNPETRRSGGMHYTSIENIHKVIDPLFLDELRAELDDIKQEKVERTRVQRAKDYQDKLASLTFMDPACGSGNFLTESYLSLRRLENEAMLIIGDVFNSVKVNIHQFYGIEINDFAVATATTALWIAEAQMLMETERLLGTDRNFLPLKTYNNIREGNALRMDWNVVIPSSQLNYIMGNPPFVGARLMSKEQKEDVLDIFGKKWKNVGNLDYVACWYKKAADYIAETSVRCALVSTNSISQGEQVSALWAPLFRQGIRINYAYRTFRWDSEASLKAHVHCIIVGFSYIDNENKRIYQGNLSKEASNINGYLIDADNVCIDSRSLPICDVPEMVFGSMPNDGGHLSNYSREEKDKIISKYPDAAPLFKKILGAQEYINNQERWCLWLKGIAPNVIRNIHPIMEAVTAVRDLRLASTRESTQRLAETPTLFAEIRQPDCSYLLVPRVSSERRRYVPIGFIDADTIANDAVQIIPNATLYHLGILISNVHNAWMRTVCGRLEMRYRYSAKIVYNNFPWPTVNDEQRERIERTAQAILDARALYPDSSLADLYDEATMPSELRRAHQDNDRAVMQAYGFPVSRDFTESDCVARLLEMYQQFTAK